MQWRIRCLKDRERTTGFRHVEKVETTDIDLKAIDILTEVVPTVWSRSRFSDIQTDTITSLTLPFFAIIIRRIH